MIRQLFALAIAVFVLGWLSHILYANIGTVEATPLQSNGESVQAAEQLSSGFALPSTGREKPSPTDRLKLADVHVTDNMVVIDGVRGRSFETAIFSDTNSMDPIIDEGSQAIQIVPLSTADIQVGDIISYDSGQYGVIIHRVIQIANDSQGWYAVVKGDNNPSADPIKVRFGMIKRVLVGVIY
jgi:signal peptidase I